jgi:hypothetical protein
MILAIYVIGSMVALIVLTVKLRETRDQLRRVVRERNAYARTIQMPMTASPRTDMAAMPGDGYTLPPADTPASRPGKGPAE